LLVPPSTVGEEAGDSLVTAEQKALVWWKVFLEGFVCGRKNMSKLQSMPVSEVFAVARAVFKRD